MGICVWFYRYLYHLTCLQRIVLFVVLTICCLMDTLQDIIIHFTFHVNAIWDIFPREFGICSNWVKFHGRTLILLVLFTYVLNVHILHLQTTQTMFSWNIFISNDFWSWKNVFFEFQKENTLNDFTSYTNSSKKKKTFICNIYSFHSTHKWTRVEWNLLIWKRCPI